MGTTLKHELCYETREQAEEGCRSVEASGFGVSQLRIFETSGTFFLQFWTGFVLGEEVQAMLVDESSPLAFVFNLGYYEHTFEFEYNSLAQEAVQKLSRFECLGYEVEGDVLKLWTCENLDEGTQAYLLELLRLCDYTFNEWVDAQYGWEVSL